MDGQLQPSLQFGETSVPLAHMVTQGPPWFIIETDMLPLSLRYNLPRVNSRAGAGGPIFWREDDGTPVLPGTRIQDGLCFSPAPFRRRQDPIVQWGPAEERMLAVTELEALLRIVIPNTEGYTLQHPVVISNEPGAPQQQVHMPSLCP